MFYQGRGFVTKLPTLVVTAIDWSIDNMLFDVSSRIFLMMAQKGSYICFYQKVSTLVNWSVVGCTWIVLLPYNYSFAIETLRAHKMPKNCKKHSYIFIHFVICRTGDILRMTIPRVWGLSNLNKSNVNHYQWHSLVINCQANDF